MCPNTSKQLALPQMPMTCKACLSALNTVNQPCNRADQTKKLYTQVLQHVLDPYKRAVPSSSLGSSTRAALAVLLE